MSYVDDPREALSEIHRVLRPKGVVAFDVMNRLADRPGKVPGGAFALVGRTPTYTETRIRDGRQVCWIFSLPRTRRFLESARARRRCRSRPVRQLQNATSVERYEARMFRPSEIEDLLDRTGFRDVRLTPLGHLAYLLTTGDEELRRFLRAQRDVLPRLSIALADHLKTDTALHLFVTARRR